MIDLTPHIDAIARRLLGDPNAQLSTRAQLRFGRYGSLKVEIAGPKRGTWFDHEKDVGGGPWQLMQIKGGIANGEIVGWLKSELGINIEPEREPGQQKRIIATYDYRDETGALLYQAVRYRPRDFRQRRPDGTGWVWKLDGVRRVPYRLPELIRAPLDTTIYIAEGEKDVDNLVTLGLAATCNSEGAGKWRPAFADFFRGRDAVVLPDNDKPGHDHAAAVAANIVTVAKRVRIVELPGLPPKGDVSDWTEAGGTRERLEALAAETAPYRPEASAPHEKAPNGRNSLPEIQVRAGERHLAADAGIDALVDAGTAFYQRDRLLVRVCDVKARSTAGDVILVPGIAAVTLAILDRALGQAAGWLCFDKRAKDWVSTDPPRPVVAQILDMAGSWPFPPLAGVIGCPTLRPDGSVLEDEGYDFATGLVLKSAVAMPRLANSPTRQDAEDAAKLLDSLLDEFPFANKPSRAVAMSMLLTPVLRGAMPVAPLHLVTAPQPGSGKSYLADTASMIATGERAAAVAVAPNPEETEKRLVGAALAGHPIIGLDNCREMLEGDFLCQISERPLLQLRALGKSDKIRISNTFTIFANGNNVGIADDMVRRTISSALDANVENPECRTFVGNPIATIRQNRGAYIAAALTIALTIARAYFSAGKPHRLPPISSYEAWSDTVRSPLVWLGFDDPVDTMAAARGADPVRQERARVFEAWATELGVSAAEAFTTPEIIEMAEARHSYDSSLVRPKLSAALTEIAQKRAAPAGLIDPRRLGRWLIKEENTISGGLKLTVDRADQRRVRYRLRESS